VHAALISAPRAGLTPGSFDASGMLEYRFGDGVGRCFCAAFPPWIASLASGAVERTHRGPLDLPLVLSGNLQALLFIAGNSAQNLVDHLGTLRERTNTYAFVVAVHSR